MQNSRDKAFWGELTQRVDKVLHSRWFWILMLISMILEVLLALLLPDRQTM